MVFVEVVSIMLHVGPAVVRFVAGIAAHHAGNAVFQAVVAVRDGLAEAFFLRGGRGRGFAVSMGGGWKEAQGAEQQGGGEIRLHETPPCMEAV